MSKQRKLRSKLSFDADDEGAADAPPPPPPPSSSAGSKKDSSTSGSKKDKKAALLSFGDDEEPLATGSSKPKKKDKGAAGSKVSKFSRGSAVAPPAPSQSDAGTAHKPTAGEYTAERLAELQAATAKLPSKYKPAAAADDGSFKLSGSFKALKKPNDDRFTYNYSIHGTVGTAATDAAAAAATNGTAAAGAGGGSRAAAELRPPEQQGEMMPLPPPPQRPGGPAAAEGGGAGGGGSDSEEEGDGFALPDEETIRRAKAKRERLRQAHLAPDYLPLGGASKLLGVTSSAAAGAGGGGSNTGVAIAGGPYGGSESEGDQDSQDGGGGSQGLRPPRQQGLGGSDSETELEERMRLTFVGQQQQQQQPKGRGSSGKGGGSRAAAAAAMASGQYAATVQDDEMQEDADGDTHMGGPVIQQRLAAAIKRNAAGGGGSSRLAGAAAGGAGGMRGEAAIAAAAAAVLESLQEATGRATARHKQLSANLKRTDDNLVNALEEADRIKADIQSSGVKYAAVQAFKAYLADLADCLAAKGPLVEELGDTLQQLRVEAAEALRQQQQDDESILYAQAEAAVTAALSVLGNGGAAPAAAAAAEAAAADAEAAAVAAAAAGGGGGAAAVDEFGRDLGLMRRQELQKGAGRRGALVAGLMQQIAALQQGAAIDLEADPTAAAAASSSGSNAAAAAEADAVQQYKRRRLEVLDLAPTVFADADEQYASLTAVKARLEGFKAEYPREYSQAYIGESAAALFAPYVRLELLQWEPLPVAGSSSSGGQQQQLAANGSNGQQQQQAVVPFDTQQWYQQLFEFGLGAGDAAAAAAGADDADANLVPQLVESLVLPMALTLVARCWDPHDLAQTRAVVGLVSDLFVYVPADKEDMAQLLALTTGSLEAAAAAAATTVPPWPSAAAAASPVATAVLQLRFQRAAALLRGLVGFKELLNQGLLFKLALGGLVGQQLVPCLRSSMSDLGLAVARAEAVVQSLPAAWFQQAGAPPPRESQSLVEVTASLGRSVEQQLQQQQRQQGGNNAGNLAGYARRVAGLLQHLGLKEQAQRLQSLGA